MDKIVETIKNQIAIALREADKEFENFNAMFQVIEEKNVNNTNI